MISTPVLEHITPEIATEYLTHNTRNRPIHPREIESLAREIKRGEYVTTHQGIAFNESGELIDGQQRLMSVIAAGRPIDIFVTRGLPDNAMAVIDRGESRSIRDVMEMFGDPTSPDAKILRSRRMISAISQLIHHGYRKTKVTANDVLRVFEGLRPYVESLYEIVPMRSKKFLSVRSVVIAGALAAMACGVSEEAIRRFFDVMLRNDISGCEDYNVSAALYLSDMIMTARANGVTLYGRKLYLATQNAIYHFSENSNTRQFRSIEKPRYEMASWLADTLSGVVA